MKRSGRGTQCHGSTLTKTTAWSDSQFEGQAGSGSGYRRKSNPPLHRSLNRIALPDLRSRVLASYTRVNIGVVVLGISNADARSLLQKTSDFQLRLEMSALDGLRDIKVFLRRQSHIAGFSHD